MVPELGHFALILALCLAALQCTLPLMGVYRVQDRWVKAVFPLTMGQCFLVTVSFVCLLYAFLHNDFSVAYVAQHSNTQLSFGYKMSALWAGHEGSLLLWVLFLNIWNVAVAIASRRLPLYFIARVLIILGALAVGFLLFLLLTSNPFSRFLPAYPLEGRDLNPLLQDLGLIIHPPMLYIGYVGFAVPFAFAMSVLWGQERDIPWAKWMRCWTLIAFGFLTVGIGLGSWWAYYELGWGGWWFWDPVENASFMPWLIGIALIHSLMTSDKRQQLQSWSLCLAIIAFALSLWGVFSVRSGILASVHAFASDPQRGKFLLQLFFIFIGSAFALYFGRRRIFTQPTIIGLSRESLIAISVLFISVSCAAVLLGTLFPLVYEIATANKLSVGFPYFNTVFIPLIIPVLLLAPLGPLMPWGAQPLAVLLKKFRILAFASIALAWLLLIAVTHKVWHAAAVVAGLAIGLWIAFGTFKFLWNKLQKQGGVKYLSLGAWGMLSAHLGVAVLVIGVTLASHYSIERDVAIYPGQALTIADYQIVFKDTQPIEGANYVGQQGHFIILQHGKKITDLYPEKRLFVFKGIKMTETAILPGFLRDIYIALGENLQNGGWSARIYYKPFVRWIWLGALMIGVGSFLSALGRRYFLK